MKNTKKNKDFSHKTRVYALIVVALIVILSVIIGLIAYHYNSLKTNEPMVSKPRPDVKDVSTLEGTVTMIKLGCGAKSLHDDQNEEAKRLSFCDGGKFIRIDDKTIYTSTGGPGPGFSVDISSIGLGDTVSAHYVVDRDSGGASLNCSRCSITVTKPADQ